jgi:hypothetical protein
MRHADQPESAHDYCPVHDRELADALQLCLDAICDPAPPAPRPNVSSRTQALITTCCPGQPVGRTQLRRAAEHNQQLLVGVMNVVGAAERA